LSLAIAAAAYAILGSSETTTFSIVAKTRVLLLRPICGAKILWDLPPGAVYGASVGERSPLKPTATGKKQVSFGFGDDAVARVMLTEDDRLVIAVRPLAPDKGSKSIAALADGAPVKADAEGFDYFHSRPQTTDGKGGTSQAERLPVTLRLHGRVVIGDALPEGAGSRRSGVPILGRGHLNGFDRALRTGERLTLISEAIDPGAVVDTHPHLNAVGADGQRLIDIRAGRAECASPGGISDWPAAGFVRGDQDGDLEVVVYRRGRSIAIAPLGGPAMEIGVTWWSRFIQSPVIQTAVATFVVLVQILGLLALDRKRLPHWLEKLINQSKRLLSRSKH
jgi:virulence-associated protein VagC